LKPRAALSRCIIQSLRQRSFFLLSSLLLFLCYFFLSLLLSSFLLFLCYFFLGLLLSSLFLFLRYFFLSHFFLFFLATGRPPLIDRGKFPPQRASLVTKKTYQSKFEPWNGSNVSFTSIIDDCWFCCFNIVFRFFGIFLFKVERDFKFFLQNLSNQIKQQALTKTTTRFSIATGC